MRYLTALRNQMAITFCLVIMIGAGCTAHYPKYPAYQRVNDDLLEQAKKRTFKIGEVKAVGGPIAADSGSMRLEHKQRALDKIPIAEICTLLNRKYSITIDSAFDKTPKVVKEGCDTAAVLTSSIGKNPRVYISKNVYAWTNNAYYGNLEYKNVSDMRATWLGDCPQIINQKDFPDVVNVTYSFDYQGKEIFYYDIDIISSGQDILNMHGIVGSIESAGSWDDRWNSYVDHAEHISEALKRDLFKTVKTADVVPAPAQDIPEI